MSTVRCLDISWQGSHLFGIFFLNNYLLDKLAVDPVFRGEEVGAGEGIDVIGGMEAGSWTEKEMMLLYC